MNDSSLFATQVQFAAHLRDPNHHPAPAGIEDRRMAIYRDLFWRNLEGFLSNGFPVLCSLLPDQDWQQLVRRFFSEHRCHSGYFVDIPGQFLEWLSQVDLQESDLPPFVAELAYYEWLELALEVSTEEIPEQDIDPDGDLLNGVPEISPLLALMVSHWPVHQISPQAVPEAPLAQPVWLLVWRDRADVVHFMELNAASARVIQLLQQNDAQIGEQVLNALAAELGQQAQSLAPFFTELLSDWVSKDIVLGTRL